MKRKRQPITPILDQVVLRELDPQADLNFILSSWLRSYRSSDFAMCMPTSVYFTFHQALASQILLHPSTKVVILASKDESSQILGYIIFNVKQPIIHYIYVKHPFRLLGLGEHLFNMANDHFKSLEVSDFSIQCTHKSTRWSKISKAYGLSYNPYIIGESSESTKDKV